VHRDVEAICCFTVTIMLLPLASTARSGLRPRKLCVLLDVGAAKLKVVQRPSLSQNGETLFC